MKIDECFSDFEIRNEECRRAVELCQVFRNGVLNGEKPWNLTLLGPSGVGKTFLATMLVRSLSHRGAKRKREYKILEALRNGHHEVPGMLESIPILMIDDLGASYDTDYSKAFAAELAERRLGKWTIWTSNLTKREIAERFDARLASRLIRDGNQVFSFKETRDYAVAAVEANAAGVEELRRMREANAKHKEQP